MMLAAGALTGRGKLSPGDMEVNYELTRDAVTRTSRSGLPSIVSWNSTLKLQRVDGQPLQEGILSGCGESKATQEGVTRAER